MRVLSIVAIQIRLWRDIQEREQRIIPVKKLASIQETQKTANLRNICIHVYARVCVCLRVYRSVSVCLLYVCVWNNIYFLYPHVFFFYIYTKIYARKHNRKTTVCPRRMKFVFTCSRLQHDGRKQLLAVTTPCSGTQTYLYTIYLVVCIHAERLNPLRYYCNLRCGIFLSFPTRSFVIRKVRIVVTEKEETEEQE